MSTASGHPPNLPGAAISYLLYILSVTSYRAAQCCLHAMTGALSCPVVYLLQGPWSRIENASTVSPSSITLKRSFYTASCMQDMPARASTTHWASAATLSACYTPTSPLVDMRQALMRLAVAATLLNVTHLSVMHQGVLRHNDYMQGIRRSGRR